MIETLVIYAAVATALVVGGMALTRRVPKRIPLRFSLRSRPTSDDMQ